MQALVAIALRLPFNLPRIRETARPTKNVGAETMEQRPSTWVRTGQFTTHVSRTMRLKCGDDAVQICQMESHELR